MDSKNDVNFVKIEVDDTEGFNNLLIQQCQEPVYNR